MIRVLTFVEVLVLCWPLASLPAARVIVSDALVRDRREYVPALPDDLSEPRPGAPASTNHQPPATKPIIRLYVTPGCAPCRRLKAEFSQRRNELPFTMVQHPAPPWADEPAPDGTVGYPVLHWQAADGSWKQFRGWPMDFNMDRFRAVWERTQRRP